MMAMAWGPSLIRRYHSYQAAFSKRSAVGQSSCTGACTSSRRTCACGCCGGRGARAKESTPVLAEYFKADCHLYELNRTNPLGMKRHISKRYRDKVGDICLG